MLVSILLPAISGFHFPVTLIMADVAAVVVPIIQPLINKLSSGVWREMEMIYYVEKDLRKLKRLLEMINNVLEDAERRSVSDVALCGWLRDIKDAVCDADDVVDDFQTEALRRRYLDLNIKGKVRNFFSSNNPFLFLYKMAHEIKDLSNRFDELARLRRDFHLEEGSSSSSGEILYRETYSSVIESEVYGRDMDKEKIISFLVNMDNDKDVSVLSIVGLGGIGKTTLAQLVYNDTRIKEHFEMEKWVCVGENFDVKHIISAIVGDTSASTLEIARQLLRAMVGEQRFLLVLDDVWNENRVVWERLEILLKGGKLGSKIIVTTRSEIVATIMGTTETPYKVKGLSHDNCWNLFRMRAFGPGKAEESPRLIEIGKEIVEKCGGLPLAAKSLGGLMASKRGVHEWLAIRNSEIWDLPLKDENILPSLRLSYDHLPSNLKQCFAYCSVFPKDRKLERLKLIQLWIAEGFIQSSREEVPAVEDIGSQYFTILLQRSFLQNEEINGVGEVISCEMHDLVHDLACLVNKGEFSTVHATKNITSLTGRYSSVIRHGYINKLALHIGNEAKKLRSLHILTDFYRLPTSEFELGPISLVTHLHVLDLSGITITVLPKIVGKLKYLRFLDISGSDIRELPESVYSLYNLQTLNLRNCLFLQRLPKGIENLSSLRHLDIAGCINLNEMPSGLGRLTALQTLPFFSVDEDEMVGCHISVLQNLNHIRGEFSLVVWSQIDPREAMAANLGAKANIQSLLLDWRFANPHSLLDEGALENLRPHPNLMYLSIYNYGGSRLPNWVAKALMLPNLKKLVLKLIASCESLPSLGQLPSLEHLEVAYMYSLRRMGEEVYGDDGVFPALKYLHLSHLPDLEEWLVPETARNGIIMFPLLKELYVCRCPELRLVRPHLPSSLVKLNIDGINEELLSAGGSLQGLSRLRDLLISYVTRSSNSSSEWGGLQHLTALWNLKISNCDEVTKLPGGVLQLPSLQNLVLRYNSSLNSLGQRRPLFCTSTLHLTIEYCGHLIALPEWVGGLTSLRDLTLRDCPKLKQLPDGLQRLTGLQRLEISDCHLLKSRLEKVTGEDWHKIAHIPNVQIK